MVLSSRISPFIHKDGHPTTEEVVDTQPHDELTVVAKYARGTMKMQGKGQTSLPGLAAACPPPPGNHIAYQKD